MDHQAFIDRIKEIKKQFGPAEHLAIHLFDDILCYPVDEIIALTKLANAIFETDDAPQRERLIEAFIVKRDAIQPLENPPKRIYLWTDNNMPRLTVYTENPDFRFNHDPGFAPYMFEMLIPEDVTPKGAIVCIPGGDHGTSTVSEGYGVCLALNKLGYQCFLLHNRVNHNPWSKRECGVDTARAIRMIRRDAARYRINPNQVAIAGFSNGGITGESCIQFYSGKQTVADHFPEYKPDALDQFPGSPDAFLCVYGPRFKTEDFDYTDVVYPPTFFAVGRNDFAMENLHPTYNSLIEHGVPVEIHTFAGTPHGVAGRNLLDGYTAYPNFELWLPLADSFMQDVYKTCCID